jgi:hypothetical protein
MQHTYIVPPPERGPDCLRCGKRMEAGYVVDEIHGGYKQPTWVAGVPEKSIWVGLKLRKKVRVPVRTYRCPKCGGLESFAP